MVGYAHHPNSIHNKQLSKPLKKMSIPSGNNIYHVSMEKGR